MAYLAKRASRNRKALLRQKLAFDTQAALGWAAASGGAGVLGSLFSDQLRNLKRKSDAFAYGEPLTASDMALNALKAGALSALAGGSLASGASLSGFHINPFTEPKTRWRFSTDPSIVNSLGIGLAGASGLLGLSELQNLYRRNRSYNELFKRENIAEILEMPSSRNVQRSLPVSPEVRDAIVDAIKDMRRRLQKLPNQTLVNKIDWLGRSMYTKEGFKILHNLAKSFENRGLSHEVYDVIRHIKSNPNVLNLYQDAPSVLKSLISSVRSPSSFMAALGGIGVGHYILSSLYDRLFND